jgi:hypothetical protein
MLHAPRSTLMPGTNRRIPHELQDLSLYFRTLPSATASSPAAGEPGTGAEVVKDRTGPDLDERIIYTQYVTEPGNFFGQINPFLPARRRPTVDHSLMAGGAQRHFPCLRATMPPSLETMRGNWKNQFSNSSSLDTSCRSPLILVMRSFGTGVFPPSSIRT